MPKMKSRSLAKKRFSRTGTGKIKHAKAYRRHLLSKKSKKLSVICVQKTTCAKAMQVNLV